MLAARQTEADRRRMTDRLTLTRAPRAEKRMSHALGKKREVLCLTVPCRLQSRDVRGRQTADAVVHSVVVDDAGAVD